MRLHGTGLLGLVGASQQEPATTEVPNEIAPNPPTSLLMEDALAYERTGA